MIDGVSIIAGRRGKLKKIVRLAYGLLADLAVFEDLVEHVGEGGGAGAGGVLRGLEAAGEVVVTLAGGAEFVGDVEGGEDGDAEGVYGVAVGGDSAHLGVDDGGETLDVGGIGAAEVVDLVVDLYGNGLGDGLVFGGLGGSLWDFEGLVHRVSFALRLEKFVHLLEHLFDAKADGIALFVEDVDFVFDGAGVAFVRGEFFAERGDFGFGGGAGFAFTLDDFYGAKDFLFEGLELVCADTRADGRCTHISTSIDGWGVDFIGENLGGIYLGADFCRLNAGDGGVGVFQGGCGF
jgi:hypothetical protein